MDTAVEINGNDDGVTRFCFAAVDDVFKFGHTKNRDINDVIRSIGVEVTPDNRNIKSGCRIAHTAADFLHKLIV